MIRMNDLKCKATWKAAVVMSVFLLFAAGTFGQQQVNLSAGLTTTTLPDGTTLPMWGYTCQALATGVTSAATCAPLSGSTSPAGMGELGGIYVLNGGSGYTAPTVAISAPTGTLPSTVTVTQATATASVVVSGGKIVGITLINHGQGYIAAPTITLTDSTGSSGTGAVVEAGPAWSPVLITVPYAAGGAGLQINLTNNLSFTPAAGGTPNTIPTSIVIEGQVGGGLGGTPTTTPSPSHAFTQGCPSWFIASPNTPPGVPCATTTGSSAATTPPAQGPRVQSMGMEVGASATTGLTWTALKPGTYLLESGTHPSIQVPMGLIGMLVVTTAPSGTTAGTAYPAVAATTKTAAIAGVTYNGEVPLEFSEIDPVQNRSVDLAVHTAGFSETTVWSGMNGGAVDAITVTNPGSGYTTPPTVTFSSGVIGAGGAAAVATLDSTGAISAIIVTNGGAGYTTPPTVKITAVDTGSGGGATASVSTVGCGQTHACYPPAVNYTPFYFLINGVAFNKTSAVSSLFAATAGTTTTCSNGATTCPVTTGITGTVLVRLVNAGLRMHVPSIVGSTTTGFNGAGGSATVNGFTLIAEDGNPLPNQAAPRVQHHVFMAAGKTYDVMVNVPPVVSGGTLTPSLPIYDRSLNLSGNSSDRDAGMLAYISVNDPYGLGLPVTPGSGVFAGGQAVPDTYNSVIPCGATATSCIPLVITDPSKGVIANDANVYGVELSSSPTNGTLICNAVPGNPVPGICANGTFTYTPTAGVNTTLAPGALFDTFAYCANGAAPGTSGLCTTVSLNTTSLSGSPVANNTTFTSNMATFIKIPPPGVLAVDADPNGLPLQVALSTVIPGSGVTVNMDATGAFTASVPSAGTYTFTYQAQNSQGTYSAGSATACSVTTPPPGCATVTLVFPQPSNLKVSVLDAQLYKNCNGNSTCISNIAPIGDYRWIIEEDQTFWVDPNCTTNSSITTAGCPSVVGPAGQTTIPTFGVQFHTSAMPFVAQGCTGPLSCEFGQTMLDTRPACTGTNPPVGCSATAGQHIPAVCDLGAGACRPDTGNGSSTGGFTWVNPNEVHLDPTKRYYISVLPGDAGNPFPSNVSQPVCSGTGGTSTTSSCGHTMSGAPIPPACNILGGSNACSSTSAFTQPVNVLVLPTPLPTGKLSLIVFEDDFPLNGEQDGGGGNGTVAPIEPGLGGFNIVLWDTYGGLGDVTGQDTYDAFNQPLSNSLQGTVDPVTGLNACPVSENAAVPTNTAAGTGAPPTGGVTGMIVTCPKYESDGTTLSPLAGQAVIDHLMPDKFSVQAYPGADRIARGEQWVQTNTLDGQHPHDSFIRVGEPSYFQEYGPAGYHVAIGFANPAIINARHDSVCNGLGTPGQVGPCTNTITGQVDVQRVSRTPDQRLYPSGSRAALAWTQCWVSLGDPDGEDFMFTFCDTNGNFKFTSVPGGNWRITLGDQWNDQIIDGLSLPANVGCTSTAPNQPTNGTTCPGGQVLNMGNVSSQQWQSNLYTRTFIDDNKNGVWDPGEIGIPFIYTMIHYRDGHNSNSLTTDFNGVANFNETYPLFNWYVVEADSSRYKTTGIHTVYDSGGPADGTTYCGPSNGARACGNSTAYSYLSNTYEAVPLPADLSVPGAVYCKLADCSAEAASFAAGTAVASSATASTGRIDPPYVWAEGWAGLTGHSNWIDFGKAPYASCPPACATVTYTPAGTTTPSSTQVGENGGIHGYVGYASTRPFDDASQMIQQPWEPNVPRVTVNLYQEGFAADGVTPTLTLVDTTQSASWDDWAQGFYPGATAGGTGSNAGGLPYMNCPGQGTATAGSPNQDLFYFTLFDQPNYLDYYNKLHATTPSTPTPLPYGSQYKCYDSMHIGNQIQPAPYDGKYFFPSSLGINPTTGKSVTTSGGVGVGSTPGTFAKASSMPGTNCTVCVPNPDSTDKYRVGTPMLPPGKYVVQVVMPAGYEVYKEEDKNLLIGDNFIAPVTQEFAGLGANIYIIPDQASVASMYDESGAGFNPSNFQDQTTGLGLSEELSGVPGFPGYVDPLWPCVGEMRVVPDFLSLFPQAKEVAPFAGATRPICDRKEVTLTNQMAVSVKFFIFTSTHIAAKYTGGITDDYTSEFDPFSPQFGEKFAPPNMPVSTRDYLGNELSRVYSDHWGTYDGLTFSSWEVNPPNITGYSPSIMVQCMNDPGPITDKNPSSPTYGQLINDPLFNPAYSDFCYEQPYMPGLTLYADTPVVPTQAFVGAAYNNADCSYPDTTPAILEVDGSGVGPWVNQAGATLTITALGDQQVSNSAYSGPSASVAPFNAKTITRHYGFGSQCTTPTAGSATCNTASSVTIGGVTAVITGWTDTSITVAVPGPTSTCIMASSTCNPTPLPNCLIQQQKQYQGTLPTGQSATAQCGQLVITAGNGKQSIDTVTVTIGGKTPTHIAATSSVQGAIDSARPGDLLIVDPTCTTGTGLTATTVACTTAGAIKSVGSHQEMLLMWKPVRLQGVGAASSVINANAQPAGQLLDPWRRHINCLFGLTLQGVPVGSPIPVPGTTTTTPASYDSSGTYSCPDTGWKYFGTDLTGTGGGTDVANLPQVDRLPLEAVLGWDATQNGNLAEQLQEPSLMGAYEGAGITVMGKGLDYHGSSPWTDANETGAFPTNTTLLTGVGPNPLMLATGDASIYCHTLASTGTGSTSNTIISQTNPYPSNFMCNPSSIDGLTITNSSQGGGGIFAHGWAHFLQIANDRVYNNAGTLTGGIGVGQGEFPTPYVQGSTTNSAPGSCSNGHGFVTNQHLPYCLQLEVNVHNNYITNNSSLGDELFSGTLAGGGGVTFCTGNDYYLFDYNWVCGNISSAEGGGVVHLGEIQNGDIEHNSIILNQSTNPTIVSNGGGIMVQGTPDTDPVCGTQIDADCPPGLSDGIGHNLVINANLIQANMAESGSGGGIRLQQVNGTEVSTFPSQPQYWNNVSITNNMIVNNLAGWDGAGISLQDALNVAIVNNTIASNDTLASSGVLTQSIGTPDSSAPAGSCTNAAGTASCPQSAGVTSALNSSILTTTFTGLTLKCPFSEGTSCTGFSNPLLQNNVIWQNRAFYIGVGNLGQGTQNQQNLVSLFPQITQGASGACTGTSGSGTASYWDIGVRGDTAPGNHASGASLNPTYSVLDDTGYAASNLTVNPSIISQYCNGSRVPPECSAADGCGGPSGYGVPPGIVDASAPNPVFSLTPSATVDEGNNWINVSWGPLSLSNDAVMGGTTGNYGGGSAFGNYALNSGSPAIDYVPLNTTTYPVSTLPNLATDFFGKPRPDPANPNHFDVGAVEFQVPATVTATVSPTILAFGSHADGTTSAAMTITVTNTGNVALAGGTFTFGGGTPQPFARAGIFQGGAGTCGAALAVGTSCTYNVVFTPPVVESATPVSYSRTLTVAYTGATVTGSPVTLTGTGTAVGLLSFTSATNGTLGTVLGVRTLTFTIPTPRAPVTSVVTITNTGAGSLGITAETLTLNMGTRYSITGTTCTTPLAPNGTCTVSIRYATPTTRPIFPDIGAMAVSNNGSGTVGGNTILGLVAQ